MQHGDRTKIGDELAVLGHLWDQYKYRHALCWSAVYKVIVAVVALDVVPYVKDAPTGRVGYWMVTPPLLGTILAGFGIFFVINELAIFANVKFAFHTLQNMFLQAVMPDAESAAAAVHEEMPRETIRRTNFDRYVVAFMVTAFILSAANTVYIVVDWVPHARSSLR